MTGCRAIFLLFCITLLFADGRRLRADNDVVRAIRATFKISNPSSTATCFIVANPAAANSKAAPFYLVTAAHVLEQMTGDECKLALREEMEDSGYRRHEIPLKIRGPKGPLWVKHDSEDVAVMPLDVPDRSLIDPIPLASIADAETLTGDLCQTGDEVRVLTYPAQVEANGAGFPIARYGTIASFPLQPVQSHRVFLIDFNAFAGDSGGPVVLVRHSAHPDASSPPLIILGLVMGQHIQQEKFKLEYQETLLRHRLAIGIAIHGEFIHQTIAQLETSQPELPRPELPQPELPQPELPQPVGTG